MRPGAVLIPGAKIALVGEAWGAEEEKVRLPFQGYSGRLLNRMLTMAGIDRDAVSITNVICKRPEANDFREFCVPLDGSQRSWPMPFCIPLVRQPRAYFLSPKYWDEVLALYSEIADANVVIPLGNTALWALAGIEPKIGIHRGTWASWWKQEPGPKLLPTYHPAAITREYSLFVVAVADLIKAKEGADTRTYTRPQRWIEIATHVEDLDSWEERFRVAGAVTLDIEVDKQDLNNLLVNCIGFSTDPQHAYVVPFIRKSDRTNYWKTPEEELRAYDFCMNICQDENITKILHRLIYDQYVLRRFFGITMRGRLEDSLVAHHALYPELPKSLAFIGSILTEEPAWKLERTTKDPKREE